MRILSVVTLISELGEYGGPVRVALNQAASLRRRGHEVIVAAATRGFSTPPTEMDGVPLALFRARQVLPRTGFAGMAAPGLLPWVWHHARGADVVFIYNVARFAQVAALGGHPTRDLGGSAGTREFTDQVLLNLENMAVTA